MNPLKLTALALGTALISSHLYAKPVEINLSLHPYSGGGAYVAVYLTDSRGKLIETLSVNGKKKKYQKHLKDWKRAGGLRKKFDGMTGASIHRNSTKNIVVNIDDKYIDANYFIHVDTAVEDKQDAPSDVVAPLTTRGMSMIFEGTSRVSSLRYRF